MPRGAGDPVTNCNPTERPALAEREHEGVGTAVLGVSGEAPQRQLRTRDHLQQQPQKGKVYPGGKMETSV